MTPYYQHSGITIYNADCRDVLPYLADGSVDITVTSPPYNIAGGTHQPSGRYKNAPLNISSAKWYSDDMPEDEYQSWLNGIIAECRRVCSGLVWLNHKVRYADRQALHPVRFINQPIYSEVIWERSGATAFNCRKFAPSHEMILGFGTPHFWNDESNTQLTVWHIHQDATSHPCSFPIEIPKRLMVASCPPDGIVIDPFVGSGTTLRAAKDMGYRAIGIEIDEQHCETAARRLEQGVLAFTW